MRSVRRLGGQFGDRKLLYVWTVFCTGSPTRLSPDFVDNLDIAAQ